MRLCLGRVIGNVAEVLRPVVMSDVIRIGSRSGRIGGLVIVAFLKPCPVHGLVVVASDTLNVFLNIGKIKGGVLIVLRDVVDVAPHEGKWQGGEGEVGGRIGGDAAGVINRLALRGWREDVQRRAPERLRVSDDRKNGIRRGVVGAQTGMLHPLRLTGLPSDHGNGVWGRRSYDRVKEVVEEGKSVGVVPQKGNGVAIYVRHYELAELLALKRRDARRFAGAVERHAFFNERITIIACYKLFVEVELGVHGHMAMVDRGCVCRIEGNALAVHIRD